MIPQGYEITGDMVPRVRNILGVPDRRDTGTIAKIVRLPVPVSRGLTFMYRRRHCYEF